MDLFSQLAGAGGPRIVCYSADAKSGAAAGAAPPPQMQDQMSSILDPGRAARMDRGAKERNHARENIRVVRQDSEINRMKKISSVAEAELASKEPRQDRFGHVQSKVASGMRRMSLDDKNAYDEEGGGAPVRSSKGSESARYKDRAPDRVVTQPAPRSRLPAVPSASAPPPATSSGPPRNYLKENFDRAPGMHRPVKGPKEDPHLAKHRQGEVPAYLVHRKQELADDKERQRIASLPPEAPPGLRLLPERERLETLEALGVKKTELERQYNLLPMTSTTLSTQNRRRALDEQLREVEGAIEIFSKPKVFVKDD